MVCALGEKGDVYLGLGSNLGDRLNYLLTSLEMLSAAGVEIVQCSNIYTTEPVDITTQDDFLNLVVESKTSLLPEELLHTCQDIEERLGRKRPGTSRTIDIDLLYYSSIQLSKGNLEIPHPRLHHRRFVLVPLQEIAPQFIDPVRNQTITSLLRSCPDCSRVSRLDWIRP